MTTTTRSYRTEANRQRAIAQLRNRAIANEFVLRQTDQGYTLTYGKGNWPTGVYTINS